MNQAMLSACSKLLLTMPFIAASSTWASTTNLSTTDALIDEPPPFVYELRGQIWPIIVGITTIDIALQSYFWGIYVPTVENEAEEQEETDE